jgi:hypothetical protein
MTGDLVFHIPEAAGWPSSPPSAEWDPFRMPASCMVEGRKNLLSQEFSLY